MTVSTHPSHSVLHEETEIVSLTRALLKDRERFLRHLFAD